jgi:hypothetical protein
MSNNNNNGSNRQRGAKRSRGGGPSSGAGGQPAQKKQKTEGQKRRQRKRQAQRNGRAMSTRGGGAGEQSYAASAYATGQVGEAPLVTATRETCRVTHREFIGNVTGTVAFTIAQTLAINPGIAATFPWLSVIAQNWETYRFRKLRLCYYTRTGTNVPGSVIMAHDPDASDPAPASEQIMTTYEMCVEDAPWKDIMMAFSLLGMNDIGPRKFVRTAALAANQDIKLYDSGNAFVATVDGTAVSWGKLWLEYDIDFFTPQLPPLGAALVVGGQIVGAGVFTAANPLGTTPAADAQAVGIAADALSNVSFTNPATYLVQFSVVGTVVSALAITAGANATATAVAATVVNGAATIASVTYSVVTTAANASIALAATATTITAGIVRVGVVPTLSLV